MTQKIYNSIIIACLIAFVCSILVILGTSYPYFNSELQTELEREAQYLCAGTELGGKEYLESFQEKRRITLIDTDGFVIYDTVDDKYDLENHLNREEVREAIETGEGESYRYSATLTRKTYYYARRLSDGTVLRVSVDRVTLGAVILRMMIPTALAFVVVLTISSFLSSSLAKRIVKPINELDFNSPQSLSEYDELSPLISKISRQNTLIELQMQDLKKQQEEFLTITRHMSEGLILIDSDAKLLSYNKSALRLLGVNNTDVGDSALTFSENAVFSDTVRGVLQGDKCRPLMEADGRVLRIYATPVREDERIDGAVLLILDVTEREQMDSLRREFTSNVSHELKTPLTSIYGISELMVNGIVKPEDTVGFAKSIHDESGRLITLVNDIIKLSRLDENGPAIEREECDLYVIAKEVIQRLSHVAGERGITLSLFGESQKINAIPHVISEMIYNLCDNAVKYNRDGGRVEVYTEYSDGHPVIRISDTGIGIPKEHLGRVFERFYRVDKSHSKKIGGTGLGLSIVKHGAAVHDANVKIESTEGEGTTVTVTF